MDFSVIDIVLLIPIVLAVIRGFQKGFLVEVSMLVGLVLGVLAGYKFSDIVNTWLQKSFEINYPLLAFAITFGAVLIGLFFLAKTLERVLKIVAMGWLNKLVGAVFSTAKWVFILSIIIMFFNKINSMFNIVSQEEIESSLLYQPIQQAAPAVLPMLEKIEVDPNWKEKLGVEEI